MCSIFDPYKFLKFLTFIIASSLCKRVFFIHYVGHIDGNLIIKKFSLNVISLTLKQVFKLYCAVSKLLLWKSYFLKQCSPSLVVILKIWTEYLLWKFLLTMNLLVKTIFNFYLRRICFLSWIGNYKLVQLVHVNWSK